MTQIAGIYKITSPDNKVYIGQSHNIPARMRYKFQNHPKLYSSVKKYGWENHIKETIHELPKDISQDVLNTYEILYMEAYKDCGIELLNMREGGRSGKFSEESRIKMSKSATGIKRNLTEEGRLRLVEGAKNARSFIVNPNHRKGKHHSEETKKLISQNKMGCKAAYHKQVICSKTGIIYNSIKDAAISIGMNPNALCMKLRGKSRNKTTLNYYNINT